MELGAELEVHRIKVIPAPAPYKPVTLKHFHDVERYAVDVSYVGRLAAAGYFQSQ